LTLIERGAGGGKARNHHSSAITAPGGDERGGGVRGRPRRNTDATCRRVCHRATRPTPPTNVQAINVESSSATATTERNRGARGATNARGGRGAAHAATPMPPVNAWAIEQRSRHHPSTCGPSTRTSPQGHHDRTQSRRQGDDERGGGRGATCAAMRLTPPVNARAINVVLKNIKKRLTWQWGWAGEDMMLATTDDG